MKEEIITRFRLDLSAKTDWSRLRDMTDEEVHAAALSDPDCPPMTEEQLGRMRRGAGVRLLRSRLGLTQEQFAEHFELPIDLVCGWEEGRTRIDAAGKSLLRLIAAEPEAAMRAMTRNQRAPE